MTKKPTKNICVPIDGSENAKRSLDYLNLIFGHEHSLKVTLLYILPTLPPLLVEEQKKNSAIAKKLKAVEAKNVEVAGKYLSEAKAVLVGKGFSGTAVKTIHHQKEVGVARDICRFSDRSATDAVMVSTKGRSRLQSFFMGEVSANLLEHCPQSPIWLLEPVVKKKTVMICVDNSENALRAVDHAGFMLSGTDAPVILFHTKRHLRRFVPKEVLEEAPELEELWKQAAGEQITPVMKKANEMLLKAGLKEDQISTKIVDGSRSAANDILKAVKRYDCGTIVMGRRGLTGVKELIMGSVTRKVLEELNEKAVWIVR
ncbi:MAG TPA: universal stress protein [Deltaproteobacteria bacterium]|nr:universal stress protein [Deltaproteobacteria bacterium]